MSAWLSIAQKLDPAKLPTIFQVNWFRNDQDGKFLWPGLAENMRVIHWIVGQIEGSDSSTATPIGLVPKAESLNTDVIKIGDQELDELLKVEKESWLAEASEIGNFLESFAERLPMELTFQLEALVSRHKNVKCVSSLSKNPPKR